MWGFLAENDVIKGDLILGVADSGLPHSVGYAKRKIELAKEKVRKYLNEFNQGTISPQELKQKHRRFLIWFLLSGGH